MAKILFFGRLSDVSDPLDIDLPADVKSTDQLRDWLSARDEALAEALSEVGVFVSVNQEATKEDVPISNGDEIAFMSALSGG